jgi:hypothetical protein
MKKSRYFPKVNERLVRMGVEQCDWHASHSVVIESSAGKIGGSAQTRSSWHKPHEIGNGRRGCVSTCDHPSP